MSNKKQRKYYNLILRDAKKKTKIELAKSEHYRYNGELFWRCTNIHLQTHKFLQNKVIGEYYPLTHNEYKEILRRYRRYVKLKSMLFLSITILLTVRVLFPITYIHYLIFPDTPKIDVTMNIDGMLLFFTITGFILWLIM